ncbi:virion structural protein [Pseudomonas phage vB_PaeS_SCUT-S3]|uniref:Virion structural protein n=1 Tax=Pseudomonas phage vB_PaeS_SCUT-S3 TaxID=2382122 RepID=A0A3S8G5V2_9CAUD|nr:virion structural protein [Pseudomonas phage vB_PaeS_SCUT-S3]AZF90018.1 virion structural protein [Pseudomonas phage vB_PaeS_SCUT-S3]
MATKKVVYFTAGINATAGELADIAKLNAAAEPQYEVLVANGAANAEYGETDRIIPADFIAGTIPDVYRVDGDPLEDPVYPEIDPDAIPNQALTATQVIVNDAEALTVPVTGTYTTTATVSVANGVVTGIVLS